MGEVQVTLPVTKTTISLKLMDSQDQKEINERIQRKVKHGLPEETLLERYRQVIKSVNGANDLFSINNFIVSMPLRDSKVIQDTYERLLPDIDFSFSHSCTDCSYEISGGLPITGDFFRFK